MKVFLAFWAYLVQRAQVPPIFLTPLSVRSYVKSPVNVATGMDLRVLSSRRVS